MTRHLRLIAVAAAFAIASTGLAVAGGPTEAAPAKHNAAWITSAKTAFARAQKENKLVVVDAFANWCGWCKRLDRDVLDKDDFVAATRDHFVLLRLNTEDGKEGSELARKHQIANLPTTVVFDGEESAVGRIVGYHAMDDFLRELEAIRTSIAQLRDRETKAIRDGNATELLAISQEWKLRSNAKKALELAGRAADTPGVEPGVEAQAAYLAAAAALTNGDVPTAEKRLNQLESVTPFPESMDGLPEILRSDIAAMRQDFDTAISILESLLQKRALSPELQAGLSNRLLQLERSRDLQNGQSSPVPIRHR